MITKIYIDVDGVIADFDMAAYKRLCGDDWQEKLNARVKGEWSIAKGLGISEEHFWKSVDTPDFWQGIPVHPGAVAFIKDLVSMATDHFRVEQFHFLTSSGGSVAFGSARTAWIHEFNKATGIHIPLIIVQERSGKDACADSESLLIEDNDLNYESFMQHGGYGVLVPRQWNKGQLNPEFATVYGQTLDCVRRGLGGLAHNSIDD